MDFKACKRTDIGKYTLHDHTCAHRTAHRPHRRPTITATRHHYAFWRPATRV